jgi:hypothetical protein
MKLLKIYNIEKIAQILESKRKDKTLIFKMDTRTHLQNQISQVKKSISCSCH